MLFTVALIISIIVFVIGFGILIATLADNFIRANDSN